MNDREVRGNSSEFRPTEYIAPVIMAVAVAALFGWHILRRPRSRSSSGTRPSRRAVIMEAGVSR
jgi:hypothetical protein